MFKWALTVELFLTAFLVVMAFFSSEHVEAQTSTVWFTATTGYGTLGGVTCTVSKVAQTPIRISYNCSDSYGVRGGSYTADATNGGNGLNWFTIDLHSTAAPSTPPANLAAADLLCLVAVNATTNPVPISAAEVVPTSVALTGGITLPSIPTSAGYSVPSSSAVYSCGAGIAIASSAAVVSWP